MKFWIASILVLLASRPAHFFGSMIVGFPLALLLFWTSELFRVRISALVSGVAGSFAAVALSYLIFGWLIRDRALGLVPLLAVLPPLFFTLRGDLTQAQKLAALSTEATDPVRTVTAGMTAAPKYSAIGTILGLLLACCYCYEKMA